MQTKTWLQRLTDERNVWLNALKAEDDGNLTDAISYYLKDALDCMKQQSLVRVALSCSCAANCLARLGSISPARKLYAEAAGIYVENSDIAMSESIREALWSLQEAFENYILAGEMETANAISDRYLKLAVRTSAFFQVDHLKKDIESRRLSVTETMYKMMAATSKREEANIPDKLVKEIENVIKTRTSMAKSERSDPAYILASINSSGGSKLNGKSIVS
jgi:hypothetical protein